MHVRPEFVSNALWWIAHLSKGAIDVATVLVLYATWRAARDAANAAKEGAQATQRAADSATHQANVGVKALYVSIESGDAALRPIIHVRVENEVGDGASLNLKNVGLGPALDLTTKYGFCGSTEPLVPMNVNILGPGSDTTVFVHKLFLEVAPLEITYNSVYRSAFRVLIWREDGNYSQQEKLVSKTYDSLADLTFE